MNSSAQKRRSANFSSSERALILELTEKYKDVLESRRTDVSSSGLKVSAWKALADEFNSVSIDKREWLQLRQAYKNMKMIAKKQATDCINNGKILESQDVDQAADTDPANTVFIYQVQSTRCGTGDEQDAEEESIILDQTSRRKLAKPVVTSSEAAAKIGDLVGEKQAYYRRKLEILNEEHEAKMRVLALKEQFYLNKKNIIII